MTPYQEAVSLVEKYSEMECDRHWDNIMVCDHIAKACSLIAVDLVIANIINCESQQYEDDKNYWQEVKKQIGIL
jgi:hypothetical protein